jgi:hypothetical protein
LGALWSSNTPDSVKLVLSYSSDVSSGATYLGFAGISINIDGKISSYSTGKSTTLGSSSYNTVSKTIYTQSENSVVIPYSVLQSMVSAKSCKLRIKTTSGYDDIDFSTSHILGGKATAITTIRSFMIKVDNVKEGKDK